MSQADFSEHRRGGSPPDLDEEAARIGRGTRRVALPFFTIVAGLIFYILLQPLSLLLIDIWLLLIGRAHP